MKYYKLFLFPFVYLDSSATVYIRLVIYAVDVAWSPALHNNSIERTRI